MKVSVCVERNVKVSVCVERTWMCLSAWRGRGGVCVCKKDVEVSVCVKRT